MHPAHLTRVHLALRVAGAEHAGGDFPVVHARAVAALGADERDGGLLQGVWDVHWKTHTAYE